MKYQIITLDGIGGTGQTTQIHMLAKYIYENQRDWWYNNFDGMIDNAIKNIEDIKDFLKEFPDGIVFNDGSIARMIVTDLCNGFNNDKIEEKYRNLINEYLYLEYNFDVMNFLLIPENTLMCYNRILKRNKIVGITDKIEWNSQQLETINNMLKNFNNNMVLRQWQFKLISINEDDTILEVHNKLLKYLEDK